MGGCLEVSNTEHGKRRLSDPAKGKAIHLYSRSFMMLSMIRPFSFKSVHDGIYALGNAHMCSVLSLTSFPGYALLVRLTMDLSRGLEEVRQARPLSFQAIDRMMSLTFFSRFIKCEGHSHN